MPVTVVVEVVPVTPWMCTEDAWASMTGSVEMCEDVAESRTWADLSRVDVEVLVEMEDRDL